MNRLTQWLTISLLALLASPVAADDLGVTMSIMVDDDDNLTESVSRQIELPQPDADARLPGPDDTPAGPAEEAESDNIRERLLLLDQLREQLDADQRLQLLQDLQLLENLPADQLAALLGRLDDSQLNDLIDGLPGIDNVEELVVALGDSELGNELQSITGLDLGDLVGALREGTLEDLINELSPEEQDSLLNLLN